MVALIFAAAPAKAGDNSIDVAVIVYDGVLTSDITAPLEVFGNAARKPWLQKINVEAVAADGDLDILTDEGIKLKADRLLADPRPNHSVQASIVPSKRKRPASATRSFERDDGNQPVQEGGCQPIRSSSPSCQIWIAGAAPTAAKEGAGAVPQGGCGPTGDGRAAA